MNNLVPLQTLRQVARALFHMPSEGGPGLTMGDHQGIINARLALVLILHRNGYEFSAPGSPRIRAFKQGPIIGYQLRDKSNVPSDEHHSKDVFSYGYCVAYSEANGKDFYIQPVRTGDVPDQRLHLELVYPSR